MTDARAGIEWVSVPLPWVRLGGIVLHGRGFEIGSRLVPGYHWWRVGVKLTREFTPRVGICNHALYRGMVRRTALGFGFGGVYAMRMPRTEVMP